jgi:hypothetical protein
MDRDFPSMPDSSPLPRLSAPHEASSDKPVEKKAGTVKNFG